MAVGIGAFAAPASAHQTGLVNVDITNVLNNADILSNNNVQVAVPITAAANICGVRVDVLSALLQNAGDTTTCTARNGNTGDITLLG